MLKTLILSPVANYDSAYKICNNLYYENCFVLSFMFVIIQVTLMTFKISSLFFIACLQFSFLKSLLYFVCEFCLHKTFSFCATSVKEIFLEKSFKF